MRCFLGRLCIAALFAAVLPAAAGGGEPTLHIPTNLDFDLAGKILLATDDGLPAKLCGAVGQQQIFVVIDPKDLEARKITSFFVQDFLNVIVPGSQGNVNASGPAPTCSENNQGYEVRPWFGN